MWNLFEGLDLQKSSSKIVEEFSRVHLCLNLCLGCARVFVDAGSIPQKRGSTNPTEISLERIFFFSN